MVCGGSGSHRRGVKFNQTSESELEKAQAPAWKSCTVHAQAGRKYMAHTAAKWWHEQMVYFGYDSDSSKSTWKMQRK